MAMSAGKRKRGETKTKTEPVALFSWKTSPQLVGYVERGFVITFKGVNEALFDPMEFPNQTHVWFGAVFLHGDVKPDMFNKLNVIDTIDERTICIKLDLQNVFMLEGHTPCVFSQPEAKRPPKGKWFHFPIDVDRVVMKRELEKLAKEYKHHEIYLVLDMFPLKLLYFMPPEEVDKFYEET